MKKHGLLKTLGILLLLIVVVSFILPGRQDIVDYIGLGDVLVNYFSIVLQNFCYVVLFVLAVGGFYGVLNKTPAYKKLVDNIVSKVKPTGKKFVFVTILVFAVVASLTGMTLQLMIFVPFVATIILLLGYDKLVAISSTVVSIMVGYIGGVFVTFLNPNTYTITTYESFLGVKNKLGNTEPKLLLLFTGIALLIYFVNRHIKSVEEKKVKYELNEDSELMIHEIKGDYKEIKTWPLIVVMAFIFVILTLGMIPWESLFEIKIFADFHLWLTGLSIKGFAIIPNIISESMPAFGAWNGNGNPMEIYVYTSMLLLFATTLITLFNKIKFNEAINSFVEGMKKTLPAAVLITIAYTVLVCVYNNGFFEGIIADYGKFNFGLSSLLAFLGTILHVDTTWIILGAYTPIINLITDDAIYSSVAVLLQGIYGITSLIGPTSLILIFALSYMDIPYTTYLKYIWRFILSLVILLALVTLLVVLL